MPGKRQSERPAATRRRLAIQRSPRPGWYVLVYRERGELRRENLSHQFCLDKLIEVAGNAVLEEQWKWRLSQLPHTYPGAPTRSKGASDEAGQVAPSATAAVRPAVEVPDKRVPDLPERVEPPAGGGDGGPEVRG
jgi:hypothetical protein